MIILNLLRFIQFSKLIYVIGSVAADEAVANATSKASPLKLLKV